MTLAKVELTMWGFGLRSELLKINGHWETAIMGGKIPKSKLT